MRTLTRALPLDRTWGRDWDVRPFRPPKLAFPLLLYTTNTTLTPSTVYTTTYCQNAVIRYGHYCHCDRALAACNFQG